MCRVELPPGTEKLFDEAARRYFEVKHRVDRGEASWDALTKAQQREMNEVIDMWRNAADQGYADAQRNLGIMYAQGQGAKQDFAEAERWLRKAADQGEALAQHNLSLIFADKKDFPEALRWARKALEQGHPQAKTVVPLFEAELRKQRQAAAPANNHTSSSTTCANCGFAEAAGGGALKPCSRCKAVVYCGKACQAQHWKVGGHKAACTQVIAAANSYS
jgi:TPR repeat protein